MNTRTKHHRTCLPARLAVLACGLAIAGPAAAIAIGGSAGTSDQGRNVIANVETPAAMAATAIELSTGRIDDLRPGQVTIRGKAIGLHPTLLRVVSPGGQSDSSAGSLRKGQQVRYALDAGSAETARRIVLIYIDR